MHSVFKLEATNFWFVPHGFLDFIKIDNLLSDLFLFSAKGKKLEKRYRDTIPVQNKAPTTGSALLCTCVIIVVIWL